MLYMDQLLLLHCLSLILLLGMLYVPFVMVKAYLNGVSTYCGRLVIRKNASIKLLEINKIIHP